MKPETIGSYHVCLRNDIDRETVRRKDPHYIVRSIENTSDTKTIWWEMEKDGVNVNSYHSLSNTVLNANKACLLFIVGIL